MLVTLRNRAAIRAISPKLEKELDLAFGTISQTFIKEHTEQGAHTSAFSIPVNIQVQLDALDAEIAAIQQSSWITVKKTADVSRNNDAGSGAGVVVDDSELQFSMEANKTYSIRAVVFFEVDGAANVVKHRWSGPSGATVVTGIQRLANATYAARILAAYDASNQDMTPNTATATDDKGVAFLDLLVQNGATPGTFRLQWVSNSATASSATIRKGSFVEYIKQ